MRAPSAATFPRRSHSTMNQSRDILTISGIFILSIAVFMAAGAIITAGQGGARAAKAAAPIRDFAPLPVARRSFTSIAEANIVDNAKQPNSWVSRVKKTPTVKKRIEQEKSNPWTTNVVKPSTRENRVKRDQPNSWAARVKKPSTQENRVESEQSSSWTAHIEHTATQEKRDDTIRTTINTETTANNILKPDTQNPVAELWITGPQGTEIAEDWNLVIPSTPFGNTGSEWDVPVDVPWSNIAAFESLAKSNQWLLFTTSNYFHEGQVGIERIITGRTLDPLGPGKPSARSSVKSKKAPRKNGSRIPAYIALLVIFAAIIALATSGKSVKRPV